MAVLTHILAAQAGAFIMFLALALIQIGKD